MNTVDPRAAALESARMMVAHQQSLAGKARHANDAMRALRDTATAITTHAGEHADWAFTATQEWSGRSAGTFDRRAGRVGKSLDRTASAAEKGATIVASVHTELETRHRAVTALIDEYVAKATPIIASGSQVPAMNVLRTLLPMRDQFLEETVKHVTAARARLRDAAEQLRALERRVEHDGVADPDRKPAGSAGSVTRPSRSSGRPNRRESSGTVPARSQQPAQAPQPGPAVGQPRPRPAPPRPQPAPDRSGRSQREGRQRSETPTRRPDPNPNEGRQRPGIPREPESRSDAAQGYDIPRGGAFSPEYPRARPPGR